MYSIVIPSAKATNLIPCVKAIFENEPDLPPNKIIVIDDGAKWGSEHILKGITWVQGVKPFIFSRNCNLGITAAGTDDIVLLNDDAVLKTPNGFSGLVKMGQNYGVLAATTNSSGNIEQTRKSGLEVKSEPRMVCFICVCIPRTTINAVGLLDEEFIGYGFDDDSYCLRVRRAGLKLGIFGGCFVDHLSLKSTYREKGYCSLEQNSQIFKVKYGASNHEL